MQVSNPHLWHHNPELLTPDPEVFLQNLMVSMGDSPPFRLLGAPVLEVGKTQRRSTLLTAQKFAIRKSRKAKTITHYLFENAWVLHAFYNLSQQMTRVTKIVLP